MEAFDNVTTENGALLAEISALRELTEVPCDVEHLRTYITDQGEPVTVDTRTEAQSTQAHPNRAKGVAVVDSIGDMIGLAEHQGAGSSSVTYADLSSLSFVTVINDHCDEAAGWRDHRITHRLAHSAAMKAWISHDREMLTQADFAEHIEDRLRDIIDPSSADMLEIAQTFHATTSTDFRSGHRLKSGVTRFQYLEEQEAKAGQARELDIPDRFRIEIEPFVGSSARHIEARFRFRLQAGQLTLGYILDDLDELARAEFRDQTDRLSQEAPWLVVAGQA